MVIMGFSGEDLNCVVQGEGYFLVSTLAIFGEIGIVDDHDLGGGLEVFDFIVLEVDVDVLAGAVLVAEESEVGGGVLEVLLQEVLDLGGGGSVAPGALADV